MQPSFFLSNKKNNRIFIFQSSVILSDFQVNYINHKLKKDFFPNWFSHNDKIEPELLIKYRHFIIISTCKTNISGCSIDTLIKQIKSIDSELSLDIFNRLNIAYCKANISTFQSSDKLQISFLKYRDFINRFSNNDHDDIYIFNNNIIHSHSIWIQPIQSWLNNHTS